MAESKDLYPTRHAGGWLVLTAVIMLIGLWQGISARRPHPVLNGDSRIRSTVDINQATAAQLCCIPHVGPSLAEKIVQYRDSYGPFKSLNQLEQVPGIGPSLRQQIAQAIDPLEESP